MSNIESINIKQVKQKREATELAQKKQTKLDDKRDMKFKVKAMKTPMNRGSVSAGEALSVYEPQEYKIAPVLMMVEAVARGVPAIAPANYERMKERLLTSKDFQYLTERMMMDYSVTSDKMKLLLTVLVHSANEVICSSMERQKEAQPQTQHTQPTAAPTPTPATKEPVLSAPENIVLKD